jgi:hypothetical protein
VDCAKHLLIPVVLKVIWFILIQIYPTLTLYTSAEQGRRRPFPRFRAAGAGGITTVETFVGAAA